MSLSSTSRTVRSSSTRSPPADTGFCREYTSIIRGRDLIVWCAALLGIACGPATRTPPAEPNARLATATQEGPRSKAPRRAALQYRVNDRKFPLPIVKGSVGGHPTLMLL